MEPPESGGSVVSRYTSMIICQRNVNRIEWHEVLRVTITGHVPAARAPPKSFTDTSATRGVPLLVALRAASPRPARPVTAHAARGVTRVYTLEINFAGRAVGFALGHSGEDCRQGWRRRTREIGSWRCDDDGDGDGGRSKCGRPPRATVIADASRKYVSAPSPPTCLVQLKASFDGPSSRRLRKVGLNRWSEFVQVKAAVSPH